MKIFSYIESMLKMLYYRLYIKNFYQSADSIKNLCTEDWISINEGESLACIYKENFFNHLLGRSKRKKRLLIKEELDFLKVKYYKIYDSYIERYGFSDKYNGIQQKKIQIFKLQCLYISSGMAYHRTALRALRIELADMMKEPENKRKLTFGQSLNIQDKLSFQVDKKKMSTQDYYDLINAKNGAGSN